MERGVWWKGVAGAKAKYSADLLKALPSRERGQGVLSEETMV